MTSHKQPITSEYDKFGDFYYDFVKRSPLGGAGLAAAATLDMVGTVENKRVCDLACGEGYLSRMLVRAGANVTGVDVSVNLLEHARRQSEGLGVEYIREDAQELSSLGDGSFDVVVCHMALMDIPDLERTYRAVWRVLSSRLQYRHRQISRIHCWL